MNFRNRSRTRSRKNSMNVMVSTEKWRKHSKRRISRRDKYLEDESDDDDPKYLELKDWVDEFFHKKSRSTEIYDQDIEVKLTRKQSLILSTLVPDEILLMDK